jgi:hypothetical protein
MAGGTFDPFLDPNNTAAIAAQGQQPPVVAGTSATQNAAPAKANAAAKKTIVSGLVDALNQYQSELVEKGTYEFPDTYVINLDPLLESATVSPPGETNLRQTPMIQAQTAADAKLGAKQKVDNNAKSTKITAGTSIVQFIDQVVRTSSYIYEQQTKIYDPKTGALKDNGVPAQTVGWYRIGMEVEPKLDQYDRKRQDYAYTITYQVNIYAVSDVKSDFFPSDSVAHRKNTTTGSPGKTHRSWISPRTTITSTISSVMVPGPFAPPPVISAKWKRPTSNLKAIRPARDRMTNRSTNPVPMPQTISTVPETRAASN